MRISRAKITVFGIGFLTMFNALGLAGAQLVSAGGPAKVQRGSVNWHPQSGTGVVAGASAQLVRTDGNVSASFQAS